MDVNAQHETPLLGRLFDEYTETKLAGLQPYTIARYLAEIKKLSQFLGRQAEPEDFTDQTICRFVQQTLDSGCQVTTVNRSITLLKQFANWMAQHCIIPEFVWLERLSEPVVESRPWLADDVWRLVETAASDGYLINGVRRGPFWQSLILTLRDTEATLAGVLSARWDDLDAPYLSVGADGRKPNDHELRRKLSEKTLVAIEEIRHPERALILDWPHTRRTLRNQFDALCVKAGLPPESGDKFRKLQRICADRTDQSVDEHQQVDATGEPEQTTRHTADEENYAWM